MSDEPKKGGFYISVELPKGYEPSPGDRITFSTKWSSDVSPISMAPSEPHLNEIDRPKGYYWIRWFGEEWEIGLWSNDHSYCEGWCWQLIGYEAPFDAEEIDEVGEVIGRTIGFGDPR